MASLKTMFSFALLGAHALGGIQKSHADFGYVDGKGPVSWYAMNPKDWSTCATGDSQSPINIDSLSATVAGPIELKIQSVAHAEIENLGTTVEVNMTGLGSVRYGGTIYTLQQMHFHTPSEHHVNNVHNEMELHMVFKTKGAAVAVLSQGFRVDATHAPPQLIASMVKNLDKIKSPGSSTTTGPLEDFGPWERRWAQQKVWTYQGSLTTPPCSQGVTWLVHSSTILLDVPTYLNLKNTMGFNARYLQNQPKGENVLMTSGKALKNNGEVLELGEL